MITKKKISRRNFLKIVGAGTAAATTSLYVKGINSQTAGLGKLMQAEDATSTMTTRKDPHTGEQISLLGYGGMRWPTKKDENGHSVIDQDAVDTLIDYAMKHGVNYYDTAPVYHGGQSEIAMGKSLKRFPRNSFHIATKLSSFSQDLWTLEGSKGMYENSFKYLQVDYIDYYLLHSVGAGKDAFIKRFVDNGVLSFLQGEREKGRIRNLGFSFHGNRESFDYAINNFKWDFVQIQLNYFDWNQDSDDRPSASYMYNELTKRHIPAVVMEPLLGGRLAKLNDKLVGELKKRDPEHNPASWAFRFVGSLPNVLTALSGITYMQYLKEDIETYSPLKPVNDTDRTFLEETAVALMKYPVVPCTGCRYCMPCPFGLDIPGNFAYFNKRVEGGNIPTSKQSASYAKARQSFLSDFNKSVPEKMQSSHCTACNHCVPLCPQHIKIPDQMKRINKLVDNLKNNTI